MPRKLPPRGFESRPLVLCRVARGKIWRRLYRSHLPSPLGWGFGPSRFSDSLTPARFGVIYLGNSVKVCFLEAILRDRGVGRMAAFPIELTELEGWTCATLQIKEALKLIDLRGDGLVSMGIPTDAARASKQHLGRAWSSAFWSHDTKPDGIIYKSRMNNDTNIAIYDRALTKPKLTAIRTSRLVDLRSDLASIIKDFNLAII